MLNKPAHLALIVTALMLADVVSSLETSMTLTALPTIMRSFGRNSGANWLVTGFLLVQVGSAAIGGLLGDKWGRRRVLLWVLAGCAAGSLLSASSAWLGVVVIGRSVQGLSGAILPLSFGILREFTKPPRRVRWIGIVSGAYSIGGALGFGLGGAITDHFGWRAIFLVTAVIPVVAMVIVGLSVPTDRLTFKNPGRRDVLGGILFLPAIAVILLGFDQRALPALGFGVRAGMLVSGAAVLVLWYRRQYHHPVPLIDVRLASTRRVALACAIYGTMGLGGRQLALSMLQILQQPMATGIGLGLTATVAGALMLPSNVISGLASPASALLAERRGSRVSLIAGCIFLVGGWGWLGVFHATIWTIVFGTLVGVLGVGVLLATIPAVIVESVPAGRTSEMTGLATVARGTGNAIGAQVVTLTLAASAVRSRTGAFYPENHGYSVAILFVVVVSIVGLLLALALPKHIPAEAEIEERPNRRDQSGGLPPPTCCSPRYDRPS